MQTSKILVPTDFTKVGDNALSHAVKIAESAHAEILVLHVVPKESDLEDSEQKLTLFAEMAKSNHGVEIKTLARIGSIFEEIPNVVAEEEANLVVMGTHGLRGMQFILGGRALRIVTNSTVPFIIVQERGIREDGYDDIVVPLDLHRETKQKLDNVLSIAKTFNSRVHLITPRETDEYLKNTLERNLKFAEQFFSRHDIPLTTAVSEKKSDEFVEGLIRYAVRIDADLIAVMNTDEYDFPKLPATRYVQKIITNEAQIPAMVINPKINTDMYIFSSYSGIG